MDRRTAESLIPQMEAIHGDTITIGETWHGQILTFNVWKPGQPRPRRVHATDDLPMRLAEMEAQKARWEANGVL